MRNPLLAAGRSTADHRPPPAAAACRLRHSRCPAAQPARAPFQTLAKFDSEFRAASATTSPPGALASVGVMAAGTGATQSKYVARRETPVYIAENCTQCMECITACPDTALPNTAQDVGHGAHDRGQQLRHRRRRAQEARAPNSPASKQRARAKMNEAVKAKSNVPFKDIIRAEVTALDRQSPTRRKAEFTGIIDKLPLAYTNVPAIFRIARDRRRPAQGGLFSIFVSDLCKGCGECVQVCGDHDALRMTRETEELNADLTTAQIFSPPAARHAAEVPRPLQRRRRRRTPARPRCAITSWCAATTRRSSPATAPAPAAARRASCAPSPPSPRPTCARSITRRPTASAPRPTRLEKEGVAEARRAQGRERRRSMQLFRKAFAHVIIGLGGENDKDTAKRIADYEAKHGPITDEQIVGGLVAVLRQDAFNHKDLQAVDGRRANGMSVMMMGASTGCNTVYGSTPPGNPHPYPWMNSLFQDGATISWLMAEIAHPQSRPPLRRARAPRRRAARPRGERRDRGRLLHAHPSRRRADDRAGNPRTAQGLGHRRRRRARRHRLPERLQGHPAEPPEREDAHARHAGVLQHRRPELRLARRCSAATT